MAQLSGPTVQTPQHREALPVRSGVNTSTAGDRQINPLQTCMPDGKISLVPSQNMYRVAEPLSIRSSSPHAIPMSPEPRAVLFLPGASLSKPSKVDF